MERHQTATRSDFALSNHGIASTKATIWKAQAQFNKWLDLADSDRCPSRLMDILGFDYFKLLDLLTIARSREHVQRYYRTAETGQFPERLRPSDIKADVDLLGGGTWRCGRSARFGKSTRCFIAWAPTPQWLASSLASDGATTDEAAGPVSLALP